MKTKEFKQVLGKFPTLNPKPCNNHEIWRSCPHCGEVWDARAHGLECPKCKTIKNKTKWKSVY